jgi:hypothetical protein
MGGEGRAAQSDNSGIIDGPGDFIRVIPDNTFGPSASHTFPVIFFLSKLPACRLYVDGLNMAAVRQGCHRHFLDKAENGRMEFCGNKRLVISDKISIRNFLLRFHQRFAGCANVLLKRNDHFFGRRDYLNGDISGKMFSGRRMYTPRKSTNSRIFI